MSMSPAEPGLAPFQLMTVNNEKIISMGGWPDLHPMPVLKAMGCEQVVYVTRRGGESIFAQGIAKRLLNLTEIDWSELDPTESDANITQVINSRGRFGLTTGIWTKMFNLANPESSIGTSLEYADAVVCTDWNAFDIKNDFKKMILEGYTAPIYFNISMETLSLKTLVEIKKSDNTLIPRVTSDGRTFSNQLFPKYGGCIPLN